MYIHILYKLLFIEIPPLHSCIGPVSFLIFVDELAKILERHFIVNDVFTTVQINEWMSRFTIDKVSLLGR